MKWSRAREKKDDDVRGRFEVISIAEPFNNHSRTSWRLNYFCIQCERWLKSCKPLSDDTLAHSGLKELTSMRSLRQTTNCITTNKILQTCAMQSCSCLCLMAFSNSLVLRSSTETCQTNWQCFSCGCIVGHERISLSIRIPTDVACVNITNINVDIMPHRSSLSLSRLCPKQINKLIESE